MAFRFGDVLLAALVFSDTSGAKKRPVMVVHDAGDADLLVVPVTSHPPRTAENVSVAAWGAAGLRLASTVRTAKLTTLAKSTVARQLGRLAEEDEQRVRDTLRRLLAALLA